MFMKILATKQSYNATLPPPPPDYLGRVYETLFILRISLSSLGVLRRWWRRRRFDLFE